MADARQPPSPEIDEDSDKEDLFASAKVDVCFHTVIAS